MKNKRRRSPARLLVAAIVLFLSSAFILLGLKDLKPLTFIMAAGVPMVFYLTTVLIPRLFPADRLMLAVVNFLCAIGILVLYRMNPQQALGQAVNYAAGMGAMLFFIYFVRLAQRRKPLVVLLISASAALMEK